MQRDGRLRAYIFVIALLLGIFGSLAGYKYLQFSALANASYERPPIAVESDIARVEKWSEYIDAVGTVKAIRGILLTSEESGEVKGIHFESGDHVQAGHLMVVLNDRVEIARRGSQRATLELAKLQYARSSELLQKNSVSRSEFDRSKADLDRARADLAETEAILANKRIRAPFSGAAGIRQVELGDYVSPGTVVATLQDLSELEIDFNLPAQSAPMLKPGQRIEVEVDAFPGRIFQARLEAVDSQIDPDTRNLKARAKIIEGEGILPGMFGYLRIFSGSSVDFVTVPETAITYSLHGSTVYMVNEADDGVLTASSVLVQTGGTRNGRTSVLSGLEPGGRVVTAGQNKLFRGARIQLGESLLF